MPTSSETFQKALTQAIEPARRQLLQHRLYPKLNSLNDLARFMEMHVFAVWDFMSLLKALQVRLTCVSTPWIPKNYGELGRLVNEIVLGEESDSLPEGGAASHYELYLKAMDEVGADTQKVQGFLQLLASGETLQKSLDAAGVAPAIQEFVLHTFSVIESGSAHEIASAFTFGREDLIPDMFTQLVLRLDEQFPGRLSTLRYYLDRHIQLDGDEHGEMGRRMVELLCQNCEQKQKQAVQSAVLALQARVALWDAIADQIEPLREA